MEQPREWNQKLRFVNGNNDITFFERSLEFVFGILFTTNRLTNTFSL